MYKRNSDSPVQKLTRDVRFGGTTFYSYVAAPIAFKALDRESFSVLQNKVFPKFFLMESFSPWILALTAPFKLSTAPMALLTSASVCGLANLFWLLPWTRRVKEERKSLSSRLDGDELERYDAPLRKEFGKSHGLSLLFNMGNAVCMLSYGVYLCRGLLRYAPK
ncbi:hypothetical protein ZYGR_0I07420 [Zygosaccharomyces rouxii]|uniref:ZYRO0C17556p n=2 Tax=Zygosaccharomyces rouxii TaxID=4956 RepID=C5DUK6_ZYGRC|nr:uncharacterized protein ZYRO0C17556g [Zygosaccharomyces rouxii]KAH9201362.1 hypothetical protein LQ764DRAFT_223273 [Zygosaccharomyces rouxii]GAV48445.1 hypothetical protein ZYGR_0I07420 [Zygosaccharomyces rouxii]CAR27467.1 ZYRO0C17556p [Zygosaccharomyces rouxii]